MQSRRLVGILLGFLALTGASLLVAEVALFGTPGIVTVLVAAVLVGAAAAWPVASRDMAPRTAPSCVECGYPSSASIDLAFCIHCGSTKVWTVVRPRHRPDS